MGNTNITLMPLALLLVAPIGAWTFATAATRWFDGKCDSQFFPGTVHGDAIRVPKSWIWATGAVLGVAALLLAEWGYYCLTVDKELEDKWELFFTGIVPFAALGFFIYQAMAGAFFATTSLTIEAKRDGRDSIIASVTIERGDHWLVDIASLAYSITEGETKGSWLPIDIPCGPENKLRLAPKEKATTMFRIPTTVTGDAIITIQALTYGLMWPVPGRSYARVLVPPAKDNDSPAGP